MIDIVETERQIVGMSLREPATLDTASDLTPAHFTDKSLGVLWGLLSRLRDAGEYSGDVSAIVREAQRQGVWSQIGGAAEIASLLRDAGLAASVPMHLSDIRNDFERRRLLGIVRSLESELQQSGADVSALRSRFDAELSSGCTSGTGAIGISELMRQAIHSLSDPKSLRGVPSGLATFDTSAGGFLAGQMVVIAARPSVGKSALAAGMCLHASLHGYRVLFISLEMSGRDIALRMLAGESGVSLGAMRRTSVDIEALRRASVAFDDLPFCLLSERQLTVDRLRGLCRLEIARGGLDALFVDYIGLLAPSDRRKPRWEAVTEVSNGLKSLALSLGIPVVALCQLSRDAEGERPKLSHLRESGAIEQDADVVFLLHRERDSSDASLNVAKIRNGQTGEIPLRFDGPAFRFSEA